MQEENEQSLRGSSIGDWGLCELHRLVPQFLRYRAPEPGPATA